MNLEKYIKDLSPELQEKARKCGSIEELLSLAKKENVELSPEALTAIGGGEDKNSQSCGKIHCPMCGSSNIEVLLDAYHCRDCGFIWEF